MPWPQRNGGAAVKTAAATSTDQAAVTLRTARPDGDGRDERTTVDRTSRGHAAPVDNSVVAASAAATVHLVDTCGRIVDVRPVIEQSPETTDAAAASPLLLPAPLPSDDVDRTGGVDCDDRPRNATAALIVGLSRSQEDHKHIPPGKQQHRQQQRSANRNRGWVRLRLSTVRYCLYLYG